MNNTKEDFKVAQINYTLISCKDMNCVSVTKYNLKHSSIFINISDGNLFRSWQLRSVIYTVFQQIKRKASTTTVSIKLEEEMYNFCLLRHPYKTRQHSEK